jgi:uncharacterized protein YlxW (UPF0749 family)
MMPDPTRSESEPPPAAEGLLERIADTALDDDYYVVRAGPHRRSHEFNTVLTGAVLAVFALLVAIAAIQTRTDRPATERERATLISDVDARKARLAGLQAATARLRSEVDELRASVVARDPVYEGLRVSAADAAATGPGIRVQVGSSDDLDAVTDSDLQSLVNGLWYSGAEAVSVNGKRIGSLSAIRWASGVIKVNFEPIEAPYEIVALGDRDSLKERFEQTAIGRMWEARKNTAGTRFDVAGSDELSVEPAPADRLKILHASAIEGDE